MSERLTTDELKAIRERCEAATAGPWLVQRRYSNECEIVPRITCEPSAERKCGWIADMVGAPYLGYADTIANADFIAHARADVPRLLAEVERLRDWKQSAMDVLAAWDRVYEALGSPGPLGSSKAENSAVAVQRLRALVSASADFIENLKVPQSIPEAGIHVLAGGRLLDVLRAERDKR